MFRSIRYPYGPFFYSYKRKISIPFIHVYIISNNFCFYKIFITLRILATYYKAKLDVRLYNYNE